MRGNMRGGLAQDAEASRTRRPGRLAMSGLGGGMEAQGLDTEGAMLACGSMRRNLRNHMRGGLAQDDGNHMRGGINEQVVVEGAQRMWLRMLPRMLQSITRHRINNIAHSAAGACRLRTPCLGS
jgi:hypothetical protein